MFKSGDIQAKRESLKKAQEADNGVTVDSVSPEDFVAGKLEEYETYTILNDALHIILSVNDTNKTTLSEVLLAMFEPSDDEDIEEELVDYLAFKISQLLKYLGVSESTIDDLLSDDENVSEAELIELADYLNQKIGDTDLSYFIMEAMHSGKATMDACSGDGEDEDETAMDWAFTKSASDCKAGKKTGLTCVKGFSNGESGYWRYPAGAGNKWRGIDNYVPRRNLQRNQGHTGALKAKERVLERARNTSHSAKATKAFKKSQSMRSKQGMTTFGLKKQKSTKAQD